MKRIPLPRIFSHFGRGAGRGSGLFTVVPQPNDFSLQSGPVEGDADAPVFVMPEEMTAAVVLEAPAIQGDIEMVSFNAGTGQLNQYTPEEDVIAEQADGRTVQLAVKGVPIPWTEAFQKGLVDEKGNAIDQKKAQHKSVGPGETKESKKVTSPSTTSTTTTSTPAPTPAPAPIPTPTPTPTPSTGAAGESGTASTTGK